MNSLSDRLRELADWLEKDRKPVPFIDEAAAEAVLEKAASDAEHILTWDVDWDAIAEERLRG